MGSSITQLLSDWRAGDTAARDRLVEQLYPELRRLAEQVFRAERRNHTLQPTALLNEAWLRLSGAGPIESGDRSHLFAVAARLMREIHIDHARQRARLKRDGGERVTLSGLEAAGSIDDVDLVDLDAALERLDRIDPVKARVVELRYFGGLSIEETAQATGQSPATVKRHWQAARAWLSQALAQGPGPQGQPYA
jgi:RNA polymerase sigma factor (TIGR02999 family)